MSIRASDAIAGGDAGGGGARRTAGLEARPPAPGWGQIRVQEETRQVSNPATGVRRPVSNSTAGV